MDGETLKHYLADNPPTVVPLKIKPHFDALSEREKLYAHYISQACFAGTRIVYRQVSPESEDIHNFIVALHKACDGNFNALAEKAGVTSEAMGHFLNYAAQFLGNGGNYKSFGDVKFVPRLTSSELEKIADANETTKALYQKFSGAIFASTDVGKMHLGYPDEGHLTTYYPDSPGITKAEITAVSEFLEQKKLLPENTRVRKTSNGDFDVLIASAETSPSFKDVNETEWTVSEGDISGKKIKLVFGDYSKQMSNIAENLKKAGENAANDTEKQMHGEYAKSFQTGSLNAYIDSQRSWIRDKSPAVETCLGFVETYRDPHGIRGEWEGFVSMVNKERTRAFGKLVDASPKLIPLLPWSSDFEKDKFLSPDFTSLEVLTFAGSGIPAGINIPNYDVVRQNDGFKNVSLGNVLSAKAPNEPIPFIQAADLEIYQKYRDQAFEVQVGLHELLGHGCGKLLQETSPGEFNFDSKNPPKSPLTNSPVTTWYKPGQTWGSVFGALAASYEECRAECVAMALCCDFGILSIFGFGDGTDSPSNTSGEAGHVLYTSYLQMARAGIAALEFWDPKSRKWGQAHMQARFSILRTFLDAGGDFCKLEATKDDLSDLEIKLDRNKIVSHGRPAVEKYLQKLQIYKATADVESGSKMYNDITGVDSWFAEKVRPIVLAKKTPRKVFVQANTVLGADGKVELREYEPSPEGMIKSFVERAVIG